MSVFYQILTQGGIFTVSIFILGFVAIYIIIERLLFYHRIQINVPEFIRGLINVLKRNNAIEAITICDDTPGPVAQVLRTVILHNEKGEQAMHRGIAETCLVEIPRLERHLKILATIAYIAIMLGLLGTVDGMIGIFAAMEHLGNFVDTKTLAGGVRKALFSTAAGLSIAIIAHGFYNAFISRIDLVMIDMEKAAAELIAFLDTNKVSIQPVKSDINGLQDKKI
jgi:biopolymer transport protein ExbB